VVQGQNWAGTPTNQIPLRETLRAVQERIAPTVERYGNGNGDLYNSIIRTGSEMLPGVGDLVGIEDLQNAAQGNDWGGIGLGLLSAIPGIPAIGRGGRGARRAGRLLDDAPAPSAGLLGENAPAYRVERSQDLAPTDTPESLRAQGYEIDPATNTWARTVGYEPRSVDDLVAGAEAMGAQMSLSQGNNGLTLSRIVVPPSARSQGVGSEIMRQVEGYADRAGLPVGLTPSGDFGGSVSRLRDFYSRFGFRPNTGRSRDFSTRETMLRQPRAIAPVEPDYPIRAFHGSPHSFDRFELSDRTIGTGEGAQAFGHGLYFAENEGIARGYRDAAVDPDSVPLQFRGKPVDTPWNDDIRERWADDFVGLNEDDADAFEELLGNLSQVNNLNDVKNVLSNVSPRARALYNTRVRGDLVKPDFGPGSMYEVGINASPDTFLDWDRPLREQSEAVRRAYAQARASGDPLVSDLLGDLSDPTQLSLAGLFPNSGGAQAYNSLTPEAAEASRRLNEYGISGIRYFDANSRGPEEIYNVGVPTDDFGPYSPYTSMDDANAQLEMLRRAGFGNAEIKTQAQPRSSNYVLFDDELVKIIRKYGISGLGLGAGLSAFGYNEPAEQSLPDL
jgi:GNAT superfamily N-acetyltransferase